MSGAVAKAHLAPDPYAPLRVPSFLQFLAGSQLSHWSQQIMLVALGWTLYDRTASAWPLAWVGLARYLPVLFFSLPGGHLADHYDRRGLLRWTLLAQLACALCLAWAAWVHAPYWIWYAIVFLNSSARALHTPVAVSFYPSLLPKQFLGNAVAWTSANYQVGVVIGFVLGGALVQGFGPVVALATCAAGPALYLFALAGLRPLRVVKPSSGAEPLRKRLLGGWHFLQKEGVIRWALTMDLFAVLFGGAEAIMPIFAKDILGVQAFGQGLLLAAGFAGALVMSFWIAHHPLKRAGRSMLLAVAGFGLCMIVFSLSRVFWLSLVALFVSGALDQISVVVRQTLVQMRTPERLRGRVQAINFLFIGSSNELGEVESGVTAGLFGPVASVFAGGVITVLVVLGVAGMAPELRKLETLGVKKRA